MFIAVYLWRKIFSNYSGGLCSLPCSCGGRFKKIKFFCQQCNLSLTYTIGFPLPVLCALYTVLYSAQSTRSQSTKTRRFFLETCLFSCFTYYYGREDLIPEELELGNFRMEIKAFFYKHLHRIHSKPLEINLFLFLGLKHPCMDWEHGLSNT